MRVNPNLVPDILADLNQSQATLNTATQEVSTGKRVSQPSDDPAAAAQMVQNMIETGNVDQYTQNITSVLSQVQSASSVLSNVVTSLTQAVSLGTEGANGTTSAANRQALEQQVQGLLSSVVSAANSTYAGSYLFGGNVTAQAPYSTSSSSPSGITYNGNDESNSVEIGDNTTVQVNLPGSQVFSSASNNVFSALSSLVTALNSGDTSAIASATTSISSALSYVGVQQGFYANAETQLNSQNSYLQQDTVTLATQENNLIGVDMATAATELTQAETANSAVLAAAAKVLPNTLLNYLTTPS